MADCMPCPLCGANLTERTNKGRFRCPSCAPTSEEARIGWLPRLQRKAPKSGAAGFARAIGEDPMFSVGDDGKVVTRTRTCECGKTFTQSLLSEYFLNLAESQNARTIALVTAQIPGYFVPVHCPRCERIDLGRQAWVDGIAQQPDYPERGHAAD